MKALCTRNFSSKAMSKGVDNVCVKLEMLILMASYEGYLISHEIFSISDKLIEKKQKNYSCFQRIIILFRDCILQMITQL